MPAGSSGKTAVVGAGEKCSQALTLPPISRNEGGRRRSLAPPGTPPSRHAETAAILHCVDAICRHVQTFSRKYLRHVIVDYEGASLALGGLQAAWGVAEADLTSWQDFVQRCRHVHSDPLPKEGWQELAHLCERAQRFERLLPEVRGDLAVCLEKHVYRHCHSQVASLPALQDVQPVSKYSQRVAAWRSEVEGRRARISQLLEDYALLQTPVAFCVRQGPQVAELMEEVCVEVVQICCLVREWVREDNSYLERLQQEVQFIAADRTRVQKDIEKLQARKSAVDSGIVEIARKAERLQEAYEDSRRAMRKQRKRLFALEALVGKSDQDADRGRNSSPCHSPGRSDIPCPLLSRESPRLTASTSTPRQSRVDAASDRTAPRARQLRRMRHEARKWRERTYELKIGAVTARNQAQELAQHAGLLQRRLQTLRSHVVGLERRGATVRALRHSKLAPGEEIRAQRRASRQQPADDLTAACRLAAETVGADWRRFYGLLPFHPPRDAPKRQRDVDTLDVIAVHRDWPALEQARACLERWRLLHRHAAIADLVRCLRQQGHVATAGLLQRRFRLPDVYL